MSDEESVTDLAKHRRDWKSANAPQENLPRDKRAQGQRKMRRVLACLLAGSGECLFVSWQVPPVLACLCTTRGLCTEPAKLLVSWQVQAQMRRAHKELAKHRRDVGGMRGWRAGTSSGIATTEPHDEAIALTCPDFFKWLKGPMVFSSEEPPPLSTPARRPSHPRRIRTGLHAAHPLHEAPPRAGGHCGIPPNPCDGFLGDKDGPPTARPSGHGLPPVA